ncbi:hypothetical protein [Streptomyces sp. NPDC093060]|uniref:hypothetical protein n=1 Tax=Streptomyces sp. NPDC093060 TaxID=3366019 RepID=UPI0037FBA717
MAFVDFAAKRGLAEVQVAFSRPASRPAVASVIAGATQPDQVTQSAATAGYEFSGDDLAELDEIFPPVAPIALF